MSLRLLEVVVSHIELLDDSDEHPRKRVIRMEKPISAEEWEAFPAQLAEQIKELNKGRFKQNRSVN